MTSTIEPRFQSAQEWCVEYQNAIAGAAFHMKSVDFNEIDALRNLPPGVPAATDGCTVWTTPELERYTVKEQRFIFLHEMCHAIFQHGPRASILKQQSVTAFHPKIWNYAADAIINHALVTGLTTSGMPHAQISMPEGLVTFSKMMVDLGHAKDERPENINPLLASYSTEQLYHELLDVHKRECEQQNTRNKNQKGQKGQKPNKNQPGSSKDSSEGEKSKDGSEGDDGNQKGDGNDGGQTQGKPDYRQDQGQHSKNCPCNNGRAFGDVVDQDGDEERTSEEHMQSWQQVQSLLQGLDPAFFERLTGEFPKVETPWPSILRDFLHRILGPKIEVNYSRPSRRYSALEGGYALEQGIDLPFEPAHDRPKVTGRIGIILDTSGSVSEEILNRFLAEVATVIETTDSEVCLIVCDADVHEVHEIEAGSDTATLRKLTYSGGGGTAFQPGIKKATESEVDAIVYLTDLYGSFGEDPGIPVLWAVPLECNSNPNEPPFGRLLALK